MVKRYPLQTCQRIWFIDLLFEYQFQFLEIYIGLYSLTIRT